MSERFQRLYEFPRNLYAQGAPVIVEAGALLMDTQTGKLIAQLKFHSVTEKPIKALKVSLATFDCTGTETPEVVEYQYLDLDIQNGATFGSNKAISIPNDTIRSFAVKALTAVTSDNVTLTSSLPLVQLPSSKTLESVLGDEDLVEQYQLEVNNAATFMPQESNGLWQCACGEWNGTNACTKCRFAKAHVFATTDVERLKGNLSERQEAARLRELEEIKLKAERKAKITSLFNRVKKIAIIVAAIACAIGIAVAVILKVTELKLEDAMSWTTIEDAEAILTDDGETKMMKTRMVGKRLYVELEEKEDFLETASFYYYFRTDTTPTEKDQTSAKNYLNKVKNAFSKTLGEPKTSISGYVWTKDIIRVELIDTTKGTNANSPAVRIVITYRDQDLCKHPDTTHSHKDATCTEDGYDSTVCNICYYEKLIKKPALGHDYTSEITRASTCAEEGEETFTCSVCGFVKTASIDLLPHEYKEKTTKAATCTEDGVLSHICTVCNDTWTERIAKLGHNMTTATCTSDSHCTRCNYVGTRAYGHNWRYDRGELFYEDGVIKDYDYYVCRKCGAEYYVEN